MVRIRGKYRCCECGKIFDEDEIRVIEEDRGEYWGIPCYEKMYYSPCCLDDFEEAYEDDEEDFIDE